MDAVEEKEVEEIKSLVKEALVKIGEHAESVHIFVAFNEGMSYEEGKGSFYTRLGQVTEWLEYQKEFVRISARERHKEDED